MPRCFRYSPRGSMGRRNFPCSTVNAQTVNSMGARFWSSRSASSSVSESLPPERATATRSPSRIILNRPTASPIFRRSVFSRSMLIGRQTKPAGLQLQREVLAQVHPADIRIGAQRFGTARAEDFPVVDDIRAIYHGQRFTHIVVGHQHADAGILQIEDDPLQLQ